MTRPSGETNEPEPPLLKRTDDFMTWSYQALSFSKLYFSLSCLTGGLLNSHIPSSDCEVGIMNRVPVTATAPAMARRARRLMRVTPSAGWIDWVLGMVWDAEVAGRWRAIWSVRFGGHRLSRERFVGPAEAAQEDGAGGQRRGADQRPGALRARAE